MQESIVNYKQASALKILGFDLKSTHFYDILDESLHLCDNLPSEPDNFNTQETLLSAPHISIALKWLRSEYKMYCGVFPLLNETKSDVVGYAWRYYAKDDDGFYTNYESNTVDLIDLYQVAEEELLSKVLEHLKKHI